MKRQAVDQHVVLTLAASVQAQQQSCFAPQTQFIQQHLRTCGDLKSVATAHSILLKPGLLLDSFAANCLINAYVRIQEPHHARQLLDEMPQPNVVSWTSVMSGYAAAGRPETTLRLFHRMPETRVIPNAFTFATVISACSALSDHKIGKKFHARAVVSGFSSCLPICSSLIDMYGKSNDVDSACRVFGSLGVGNVVSWTSMISVFAQNAQGENALRTLRQFNHLNMEPPNQFMLSTAITASASLGKLGSGKAMHAAVIRRGHDRNAIVASSLVDMYAKCGCIGYSHKVFNRTLNPSVIAYTSMIAGAAKHGLGGLALQLFEEMLQRRIRPNLVTYVAVLYACSHSGLVDQGLKYFKLMREEHGLVPDEKHYTCVVDMLSRCGRLDEAYELAKSMEVEGDGGAILWSSLLSAGRLHGREDIAGEASKWLIEANQKVAFAYVTMSNAYAVSGKWDNLHDTRAEMKRRGIRKDPGCSWLELQDTSYVFYAGDVSACPRGDEVLALLRELEGRMKERGYVGVTTGLVFVEVEEEDAKEEIVGLHSERLALGFALLSVPRGVTIRIMKNLRMCRDCHEAFKLIADIMERDIVVRDVNRFHHFRNGSCTCKDFW